MPTAPNRRPGRVPPRARSRFGARRLFAAALVCIVAVVLVIVITGGSSPAAGYDVSYPQCAGSFPSSPIFGIVGVNGGVASDFNPCLAQELAWAGGAPGQKRPNQPALSLYIDTGNPGAHHVAAWPSAGTAPVYGTCNGLLTNACSYLYGEQRGAASFRLTATDDPAAAKTAPWWLDVELMESWAGTYQLNIAALKGFIAGLRNAGATGAIGLYSTGEQWKEITGLTAQTTSAAFNGQMPGWVAGGAATSLAQARQNCASEGFTGTSPVLAQYRSGAFDADLRCGGVR